MMPVKELCASLSLLLITSEGTCITLNIRVLYISLGFFQTGTYLQVLPLPFLSLEVMAPLYPMHPSQGRGLVQLGSQMHHAAGLPQELVAEYEYISRGLSPPEFLASDICWPGAKRQHTCSTARGCAISASECRIVCWV